MNAVHFRLPASMTHTIFAERATPRLSDACYSGKQASIWSSYLRTAILISGHRSLNSVQIGYHSVRPGLHPLCTVPLICTVLPLYHADLYVFCLFFCILIIDPEPAYLNSVQNRCDSSDLRLNSPSDPPDFRFYRIIHAIRHPGRYLTYANSVHFRLHSGCFPVPFRLLSR